MEIQCAAKVFLFVFQRYMLFLCGDTVCCQRFTQWTVWGNSVSGKKDGNTSSQYIGNFMDEKNSDEKFLLFITRLCICNVEMFDVAADVGTVALCHCYSKIFTSLSEGIYLYQKSEMKEKVGRLV